ncbi:hypothetical protein ACTMU2_40095 [Cupriavidus basilensis]
MEPARNRQLAECAVADTGLGNVEDKIRKNYRKTLGLLQRDLHGQQDGRCDLAGRGNRHHRDRAAGGRGGGHHAASPIRRPRRPTRSSTRSSAATV